MYSDIYDSDSCDTDAISVSPIVINTKHWAACLGKKARSL